MKELSLFSCILLYVVLFWWTYYACVCVHKVDQMQVHYAVCMKNVEKCFFLWLQNGVLMSDKSCWPLFNLKWQHLLNLVLSKVYWDIFFHHPKLLVIEKYCKNYFECLWLNFFIFLHFNLLHMAFSDYKSGFGGKFGVQTERQDPSAVGFDYKEKLAKHESQQGTVFTCYFLNSAATSHTVLNSFWVDWC